MPAVATSSHDSATPRATTPTHAAPTPSTITAAPAHDSTKPTATTGTAEHAIITTENTNAGPRGATAGDGGAAPVRRATNADAGGGHPAAALALRPPFLRARHLRTFVDSALVDALVAERQRRQHRGERPQEEEEEDEQEEEDGAQAAGDEPARTAERRPPGIGGWASYWASASARAEAELAAPMAHHSAPAAGAAQAAVVGTPDEALSTLERTRLVVGFHPDQATEAAVDLALALRVPFAVVPCCVFPSLFPHRRTREGKPVASYDEFVEYLRAKVAGVR